MRVTTRSAALLLAMACAPDPASAQLGEMHLGALLSYGIADALGPGVGLVLGVAAGRLTYIGVRGAYHFGSTERRSNPASTSIADVRTHAGVLAADLGVLLPVGAVEIVPGVSIGAIRFAQRVRYPQNTSQPDVQSDATRLLVSPGISTNVRVARILLIPELQFCLASDPELPRDVDHRGPVLSLRVVVPEEVGRIRR